MTTINIIILILKIAMYLLCIGDFNGTGLKGLMP